jgi:hypothetical protein
MKLWQKKKQEDHKRPQIKFRKWDEKPESQQDKIEDNANISGLTYNMNNSF